MAIDNIYDGEIASSVLTKLNASINEANKVMNGEVKVQFARSSIDEIRAITDYIYKVQVLDYSTFKLYEFNSNSVATDDGDTVLKPDNLTSEDSGRWIKTVELASNTFTASFSFSGIDNFKQVFGKDVIITSVTTAPDITDLRIGLNGATPTTITTPLSISAIDVVEFEATYDQEADSYFTLIGKEIYS